MQRLTRTANQCLQSGDAMTTLDEIGMLEYVRDQVAARYKTQSKWADRLGVSSSYVSQVLSGDRPVSKAMLADLGISVITTYGIAEPA